MMSPNSYCRAMLLWAITMMTVTGFGVFASAFAPTLPQTSGILTRQRRHCPNQPPSTITTITTRFLSDVPQEHDPQQRQQQRKNRPWWKDLIPPPPEDQLTLSGDIAALFVYTFLDHYANQVYVDSVLYDASPEIIHSLDPTGDLSASQLPVWFDADSSFHLTSDKLSSLLGVHHVAYSPILGAAGLASVLLCACWLVAGYAHQAFLFRNTLDCRTENAIMVTFRTWITSSALMVAIALGADYICGQTEFFCNCPLTSPTLGGLTKADADFIFDSLAVLITWRFILSTAFVRACDDRACCPWCLYCEILPLSFVLYLAITGIRQVNSLTIIIFRMDYIHIRV